MIECLAAGSREKIKVRGFKVLKKRKKKIFIIKKENKLLMLLLKEIQRDRLEPGNKRDDS